MILTLGSGTWVGQAKIVLHPGIEQNSCINYLAAIFLLKNDGSHDKTFLVPGIVFLSLAHPSRLQNKVDYLGRFAAEDIS